MTPLSPGEGLEVRGSGMSLTLALSQRERE
jgi:hypothetical protein